MGAIERNPTDAVSPLFADIHAQYGAAFDAALARNVA
ncbi:nicotinate-nucleotide diphosphorylase (carboxylating), partial [Burkholderia sp. SIMBA_048]